MGYYENLYQLTGFYSNNNIPSAILQHFDLITWLINHMYIAKTTMYRQFKIWLVSFDRIYNSNNNNTFYCNIICLLGDVTFAIEIGYLFSST